ncbi:hypothetical protein CY34DRAFT_18734 [Suillus luteus UH-Slu-Lm8-n1]|uniref:DUF6532 domain-containing protein n=1 Tax=Suillus luteus UH-Slu-Lm8-n1 TaxID=930992 RepID=A0A0C9Z5Z8_9AGAM|nr:hypothetical protein CY34DRAFT_18734 [Suillus luteus UH-Slu-Lm8-n1]
MTTTPQASFQPILYDPANPNRRLTTSERSLHRLKPYARTTSTSGTMQHETSSTASGSFVSDNGAGQKKKRLALCDLPEDDRPVVRWTRSRLVMDLLTTVVWPQNELEKEKEVYLNEILHQANSMFGTKLELSKDLGSLMNSAVTQFRSSLAEIAEKLGREFNIEPQDTSLTDLACKDYMQSHRTVLLNPSERNRWQYFLNGESVNGLNAILLMFGNPIVEKIHLLHLYTSNYTPLRDKMFRKEITMTTLNMFSHVAVGVECGIDRIVDGALSGSGRIVRFTGEKYAQHQVYYMDSVTRALLFPIHQESLPARFLDLHLRGLQLLKDKMGLMALEHPIYVPQTMAELTRPLFTGTTSQPLLQSSSAEPQIPVQEELLSSCAGNLTESTSSTDDTSTSPTYNYGSTLDSQSGIYYEPISEDEDLVLDTQRMLNRFDGYAFY